MRRREFLRAAGASAVAFGSGCLATGGEVILSVQQGINLPPGEGWVRKIPDVSDTGGAISYAVRSTSASFTIYFFVGDAQYEYYERYMAGESPQDRPDGHADLSKSAVRKPSGSGYEATTKDDGARERLDETGPYYFVVDYSNYRLENPVGQFAERLSAGVDLTVVERETLF